MKIESRAVAAFLRAPDPAVRAILLYGHDEGKVRERGEDLARRVVPDLNDPFRVAEFTGAALTDDPARLADEAAAIAMTGGRRVVRVRQAGNDCADIFAQFFKHPVGDALIVVEAGDLEPRAKLCVAFEKAENAAAVRLFSDDAADLSKIIGATLAKHNVSASSDAMKWLTVRLGGDSIVVKGEAEKLALYVGAGGTATLDDVRAAIGDSAELGLDDVARAVATGDVAALSRALDRLGEEGVSPIALVRATQRHFTRLHLCAGFIASGRDEASAFRGLRPPVFRKEEAAFRLALKRRKLPALARALHRLIETEVAAKTASSSAALVVERCLLDLTARAD
jgi:DNA polymerase-3 subunit delta